jgi:hypothetical protein
MSSSWRLERFTSSGMLHCENEHTVPEPRESSNESRVPRKSLTLKCRPCDLLNGQKLFTNQQVTFQKTWIFCNITARTSNLQLRSCSAVSLTTGCCIQLQQKWASFQTCLTYLPKSAGNQTFTTIPVNQNVIHTVTHSHLRATENLFFVTYMSDE